MGRELYSQALLLIRGRVAEAVQRSLPASLAARVERLERELRLALQSSASSAGLAPLLEALAEYVAAQRRVAELAAALASRAGDPGLKLALAQLSRSQARLCELVASLAGARWREATGPAR